MPEEMEKPDSTNQEAPKEFSVTLETGQVYKAETQEALIKKLVEAQENASKAIKEQRDMNEALRSMARPEPEPRGSNGTAEYRAERYFELWAKDPIEAQNYLDAYRFGQPFEEIRQGVNRFGEVFQDLEDRHKMQEAVTFRNLHPEYDVTPENAELMAAELQRRGIDANKQKIGLSDLEASFYYLKEKGKIKIIEPEQPVRRNQPPPNVSGVPGRQNSEPDLNSMSDEDLERYFKKHGAFSR